MGFVYLKLRWRVWLKLGTLVLGNLQPSALEEFSRIIVYATLEEIANIQPDMNILIVL